MQNAQQRSARPTVKLYRNRDERHPQPFSVTLRYRDVVSIARFDSKSEAKQARKSLRKVLKHW